MWGAFSYGLPNSMGPALGALYVSHLIEAFTNGTDPFVLEFGHDTTIDMALSALGLAHDKKPLSAKGPVPSGRAFRTSSQVPFAAQMVWEKFECATSFKGPQIRLVLNDSPLPLSVCKKTDRKYGSCALDDFVASQSAARSVKWGDQAWNATCGNAGF
jgi:acid phosphatase